MKPELANQQPATPAAVMGGVELQEAGHLYDAVAAPERPNPAASP